MKFSKPDFLSHMTVTLAAALIGTLLVLLDIYLGLDLFGLLISNIAEFHKNDYEIDEFILFAIIILIGASIDTVWYRIELKKRNEIIDDRLHTMQLTMTSVNDIVNNLLTNMQFIQFKAEQGIVLDHEEIKLLDTQIKETAEKIQKIHELEEILDRDLGQGISGLQFDVAR